MENRYRLVLYNDKIYKEVELGEDCKQISVGTYYDNEARLKKELFFENFFITLKNKNDEWEMDCSSNIYFECGDARKIFHLKLNHGDEYVLRYEKSNSEFLKVAFSIDFDLQIKKYDCAISLENKNRITIGTDVDSDIRIKSPYIVSDRIHLVRNENGYCLHVDNTTYGVCVNGLKIKKNAIIKDGDFFSIANYSFYYKDKLIMTDIDSNMSISNLKFRRKKVESTLEYPKFNRNTRIKTIVPKDEIPVLDPPQKPEKPKNNFLLSLIPSIIMLILTIVLRGVMSGGGSSTFVIFSACTMGMGIITSIITYVQGNKEFQKSIEDRENKYRQYTDEKCKKIEECREEERNILERIYLDIKEIIKNIDYFSGELFDRTVNDEDFLCVRLGTGKIEAIRKIEYKMQEKFVSDDELTYIPENIMKKYQYIENTPIILKLRQANVVGFIGEEKNLTRFSRNLILDLSGRHYADDVKFVCIMDESQKEEFNWIRFLPHIKTEGNSVRNIACDTDSKTNIFETLYKEFSRRVDRLKLDTNKGQYQHLLVFVFDDSKIMTHPLSRFIEYAAEINVTFLFFVQHKEKLPLGCSNIVYVNEKDGKIIDTADENNSLSFEFDVLSKQVADKTVQKLAPIYCEEVNLEGSLVKNISFFELLNIYGVEDLDLTARWAEAHTQKSLAAPLGVKTKDEVVCLDVHEKAHGPHGLVAGTTGSGKSEILQSYILSMATLYHPYEVGFVIIDFKGGGMANQFLELPHLIGTITNIDGKQINRSLLSIKAELLKRQNYFAEADVNHIDKYISKYKNGEVKIPLPHLIIIVDEFAELKAEHPDFMKELISAARIGRSLGVHLILATQKPSGQVNEQIWSNSRFKLCLKVQSPEDSNEMIKSPLAAEILEPGRAYFQVGNNEIFDLFQSGYSGAPEKMAGDVVNSRKYKISEISFSGKRNCVFEQNKEGEKVIQRSQLEAVIDYVKGYCEEKRIQRLDSICLPPLPEVLVYPQETHKSSSMDIIVEVGLLDDPNHQKQEKTYLNLTQENTMIIGSSQYGKTNLLQTIIRGLANTYSPQEVNIYVMDFGSMVLRNFDTLKHVGGVVVLSEDEKFQNLVKLLNAEILKRKEKMMQLGVSSFSSYREAGKTDLPQIVLLIDNFTALKEYYLQEDDPIMQICREGLSVGVSVILCNPQTSGMGYRYMSNFSKRIALYCNESGEYSSVIERCRIAPDNIPGRALTEINREIFEMQTYLSFEGEKEIDRVSRMREFIESCNERFVGQAKRIPEIPKILHETDFVNTYDLTRNGTYVVPVGLYYDSISAMKIDLLNINWFATVETQKPGSVNLLKVILNQLYMNLFTCPADVYIVDNVERKLHEFSDMGIVCEYTIDSNDIVTYIEEIYNELLERYENVNNGITALEDQTLKLVVIRNQDAIGTLCKNASALKQYKEITGKLRMMKVCFLFMDIENAAVPYSAPEILKTIKENKKIFFFDELQNLKVCDISAATLRKFKKNNTWGDSYWLTGNEIRKVKIVESEKRDN